MFELQHSTGEFFDEFIQCYRLGMFELQLYSKRGWTKMPISCYRLGMFKLQLEETLVNEMGYDCYRLGMFELQRKLLRDNFKS